MSWITSDQGAEVGRDTPGRNDMAATSDGESDIHEDASDALSEGWDQSSQDDFLVPFQLLQWIALRYAPIQGADYDSKIRR